MYIALSVINGYVISDFYPVIYYRSVSLLSGYQRGVAGSPSRKKNEEIIIVKRVFPIPLCPSLFPCSMMFMRKEKEKGEPDRSNVCELEIVQYVRIAKINSCEELHLPFGCGHRTYKTL